MKKVIANLNSLTEEGSNLLLDRIDKICEGYVDLIEKLSQTQKESKTLYRKQKNNFPCFSDRNAFSANTEPEYDAIGQ